MRNLILATTVLAWLATSATRAQNTAAANPSSDLDYFVGKWIWEGQINLHGEAPQSFVWRDDCERTLDGRFILQKQCDLANGLKLMHIALTGWDDESNTIKGWGFWSPPGAPHEEVIYTKTDSGWRITREGLDGVVTVIDNNAWKYEAEFERDGKKSSWGFKARRITSPTKADAKKAIDTLVGQWALKYEEEGQEKTAIVTATRCSSDLALRVTYQEPGQEPANGMFAWHATDRQIVETWFRGGEHVRVCFDGMTDDGALIGPGEGMLDGKQFSGVRCLKFQSNDHYTHTIQGSTSEGELLPDITLVANRVASESAK